VWETNLHKAGRIRLIACWKLEHEGRCRCRKSDKSDLARGLDANERADGQCKGMKKADGAVVWVDCMSWRRGEGREEEEEKKQEECEREREDEVR
jgi:hypothetical protein